MQYGIDSRVMAEVLLDHTTLKLARKICGEIQMLCDGYATQTYSIPGQLTNFKFEVRLYDLC